VRDELKTRAELLAELEGLRQRLAELEPPEADLKRVIVRHCGRPRTSQSWEMTWLGPSRIQSLLGNPRWK